MIVLAQRELLVERSVNVVPHFVDGQRCVLHKFALIAVANLVQDHPLCGDVIQPAFADGCGSMPAPFGIVISRTDAMFIGSYKIAGGNILIQRRIRLIA